MVLCLNAAAAAHAAMYVIENPAAKISNPADKMYNPAAQTNNPASTIYNPGTRMDNPSTVSPVTPPAPSPAAKAQAPATGAATHGNQAGGQKRFKPAIPQKKYYFTNVGQYVAAAKKYFAKDDYVEFLSVTEDALRRIGAGTLKASAGTKHKLHNYKVFGYGLLE